jgi:phenylpyruvate tautomerase PptA (4-oxalocrotonate tautomerase family)
MWWDKMPSHEFEEDLVSELSRINRELRAELRTQYAMIQEQEDEEMDYYFEKLKALVLSRRFQAAVAALVTVVVQDLLGLTEQQVTVIVQLVMAWIVGDSIYNTTTPKLDKLRGS